MVSRRLSRHGLCPPGFVCARLRLRTRSEVRRARAGQRPCRSGAPGLGAALPARPPTAGLALSPGASHPEESPYLPLGVSTHGALPLGQGPPAGPHLPPASLGICPLPPPARPAGTFGDPQPRAGGGLAPPASRSRCRRCALSPPAEAGLALVLIFFVLLSPPLSWTMFFSFSFSYPVLLKSFTPFPLCVCENT